MGRQSGENSVLMNACSLPLTVASRCAQEAGNSPAMERGQAYLKRPGRKEPARGVLISFHLHQREGEVAATAALHRLVDPDHGERLQEPRVLQRAGIDRLEAEHADQLHHHRFPRRIVTRYEHERFHRIFGGPGAALNAIKWSVHSRQTDPIRRSTYPFCQGERNEVGRSRGTEFQCERANL